MVKPGITDRGSGTVSSHSRKLLNSATNQPGMKQSLIYGMAVVALNGLVCLFAWAPSTWAVKININDYSHE